MMKGRLLCEKNNLPFQIDIYCVKCYIELPSGIPAHKAAGIIRSRQYTTIHSITKLGLYTDSICRNGAGIEQINDYY